MVSIVNDPRHPYFRTMTVLDLGNVVEGKKVTYLNVSIDLMKKIGALCIKGGEPVWFGCDVGKFFDGSDGVMDLNV